ncbi:MAG: type IV pilus secretin PilQ [Syntrophaceae bacterium]|nr:type IV pilus secretin PilQ [Syntrophaceae bacterium]
MRRSQILVMTFWVTFLIFIIGGATGNALAPAQKPEESGPMGKVSQIEKITFTEGENFTRIQIEGSDTIAPPLYKLLTDPTRIAIDVPNIDLKQIRDPLKIENGTVGEVLTTQYDDKGRIEISLIQMTNYNISKEDKHLIIDIEKIKPMAEAKEIKNEEVALKESKINPPPAESKIEESPSTPTIVSKAKEVANVLIEEKNDRVTFNIIGNGRIENYDSFKLDSPARLVVDLWGIESRYPKKSIKMNNPFVKAVRLGQHPDKLRLVFDASKSELPPYQINRIDEKLIVALGSVPQPSEPQILLEGKLKGGAPAPTVVKNPTPPEGTTKKEKTSSLTEINFKQMDHKSRIVVMLTDEPKFESYTLSKNIIAVDIKNAFVPKHLQRGLDTSEFESGIQYITIQNVKTGKTSDVRISIKIKEALPFETSTEGNSLFIDIEKPQKGEAKVETPIEPKKEGVETKGAKREEVKKEELKKEEEVKKVEKPIEELKSEKEPSVEQKPIPKLQITKISEEGRPPKIYSGRKLSLDFKDADIKNILRLIAEVSNLNIIAGDDVTGKITMRLVDVPWDQALEIILQSKNLGMSQVGNVVRIAPLESLKREVQAELEAKRAKERLEDLVMELIPLNYTTAKEMMPQVKSVLSERGDVKVDERTNTLIVKDIAKNIPAVKNLVKSLDTKTPLVMIEARIVEASTNFQRELGTRWGFVASGGDSRKVKVGGGNTTTTQGTATSDIVNLPAVARSGLGALGAGSSGVFEFLFTSIYGLEKLDVAISAHENKGDLKIISSPKIATLDNKEASVEQGLRIPYLKLTTEGTVTTDFIDANLKLSVTPHVTNDGHIKLNIKAKKDAPDTSIVVEGVPSIDKKEAITEVLVKDGAVIAIAGIYTIQKSEGAEGVPLFNKIPLLGWLFKRENKEDSRKDLLIFISPKIIKDQI